MPIITATDLGTNIYPEIIEEITRSDSRIADRAITTAVQEAKMYLVRYDLEQLFGSDITDATIRDEYLNRLIKDIACWHLIRRSNTGIDYAVFRTAYEDAIAALKNIMSGQAQPQGWPYLAPRDNSIPKGDAINWSSNPKRNNFY